MSTVPKYTQANAYDNRIRPQEEPRVGMDMHADEDEREDHERLGNDLEDLELEALQRVQRVAQQELVPGEHENREARPQQRPHTSEIQSAKDERQSDGCADNLERRDVVPVACDLVGVTGSFAYVQRGEAKIRERPDKSHIRDRRLHLAEPGRVQVVADDDHCDERDDPRHNAHDEDQDGVAQRPHPQAAGLVGCGDLHVRRGFVLQGAHSIAASAQCPPTIPADTLRIHA